MSECKIPSQLLYTDKMKVYFDIQKKYQETIEEHKRQQEILLKTLEDPWYALSEDEKESVFFHLRFKNKPLEYVEQQYIIEKKRKEENDQRNHSRRVL